MTLVQQTVDGRPAIVAYLTDEMEPTTEEDAYLIKIVFLDKKGGVIFLIGDGAEDYELGDERNEEAPPD